MSDIKFLLADPFGDVAEALLDAWFGAAYLFAITPSSNWGYKSFITDVNDAFRDAITPTAQTTQINPHIFGEKSRLYRSARKVSRSENDEPTRPYLLLRSHFENDLVKPTLVLNKNPHVRDRHNRPRQILVSPYRFVLQMLTNPEAPGTSAYAASVTRALIYQTALEFAVKIGDTERKDLGSAYRYISAVISYDKVATSLSKAHAYHANGDTFPVASVSDFIVGHMLAAEGLAVMSFAPYDSKYESKRAHEPVLVGRDTFLGLKTMGIDPNLTYQFKFGREILNLPSIAEMMNSLDGIPLPIQGATTIFAGGLKLSTERGTVLRVSGSSGSGKTSLALALAGALAPLGVTTTYLTSEEDQVDLEKRLISLVAAYTVRTQSFPKNVGDWFQAIHLSNHDYSDNYKSTVEYIELIIREYKEQSFNPTSDRPPGISPFLFIIDGTHELFNRSANDIAKKIGDMHELIEKVRALGAIVLILTADIDEPVLSELDYIVDTVIDLKLHFSDQAGSEARRTLTLKKSRLQHSLPGVHGFHISKGEGIKIFPQIRGQVRCYSKIKPLGPNTDVTLSFMHGESVTYLRKWAVDENNRSQHNQPHSRLRIFERSLILVTGFGSTGKAAFGLRLLASERLGRIEKAASLEGTLFDAHADRLGLPPQQEKRPYRLRNRILVVSFLYSTEYYNNIVKLIKRKTSDDPLLVDVLNFYPGFLSSETFMAKVVNRIEAAQLEGMPYKGILIDGLHNMFLQFPILESQLLTLPILYSALSAMNMTVVTTHTHFSIPHMERHPQLSADVEIATRRVAPLLQAIINAADFFFDISDENYAEQDDRFPIRVVAAFGQSTHTPAYFWNRGTGAIEMDDGG